MASKVERDKVTNSVVDVKLDEVIPPGDPRWGIHNPVERETDTLSVHEEDPVLDVESQQVDVPQKEPVPSDELYIVDSQAQPSQQAQADASKSSSSKSDKS